jgi:hypothetical protein
MTGIICIPMPCFGCNRLVGILLLVFWAWVLMDCIRNEPAGTGDKYIWIAVIALTSVFGAALYLFIRRPQRIARYGR